MFKYDVMSEQEAMQERFQLLKEGEYDAVIKHSEDKQSATGNPMMDMTLAVFDENGRAHDVRDFLVFTKSMMWRVIHFAKSASLIKEYESENLCSKTAANKSVRIKLVIEEGSLIPEDKLKGKQSGTKYPSKNKVADYLVKEDKLIDSDIPF